ncbi:carboxylesterase/lipase family protein [Novosphingobium sp. KN65.2]|uniref:carboxylesterase/lipase family protein n=1 Tax=Novosphingobium sp. KN65.2 TaxID=1478134 RepID=UPI0005DF4239|nr:carboxylesterase family protein [Novosphingobium sp. KN65.2]CDO34087.1 putative Carboxylesterase, type B [Novosphingobium sp. KN65.2]
MIAGLRNERSGLLGWVVAHAGIVGLLTATAGGVAPAAKAETRAPVVRIDTGALAGIEVPGAFAFLGIPCAGDTGGVNQWKAPTPVERWRGTRAATAFGADCQQDPPYVPPGGSPWSAAYFPTRSMSEDCLFLNVWTPRLTGRKPVMVWIHGGGFAGGSASVPIYDGAKLAARGIVVVTINYRVGAFGFLAHPALTAEAGSSGNYGLMDQIAALRWVKRNIARFGGDPSAVTIAGQSAGAASVHALLAAPSAEGLFHRAIAESGSGMGSLTDPPPLAVAEAQGVKVAQAAGAIDLASLRSMPVAAIQRAANDPSVGPPGIRFRPVTEPRVLPDPHRQRSSVPVLTGLTADETSTSPDWHVADAAGLQALLERRFGKSAAVFRRYYGPVHGSDPARAARSLLREQAIAAMMQWADRRPRNAAPVFAYLFDHPQDDEVGRRFGSFHTTEVPYVFATVGTAISRPSLPDRLLSEQISGYWTNFVRTGNPNGGQLPSWPALSSGRMQRLSDKVEAVEVLAADRLRDYRAFVASGGQLGLF